jgi:hypothetical protein
MVVPTRAVGKGQRDHGRLLVAHSLRTDAGKRAHDISQRGASGNAALRQFEYGGSGQAIPIKDHIPVKRSRDRLRKYQSQAHQGRSNTKCASGIGGATITTKCVCGLPRLKARGVPHGWMPASAASAACVYLRRDGSVACRRVLHGPPACLAAAAPTVRKGNAPGRCQCPAYRRGCAAAVKRPVLL